jgi:hypothetical protein
MICYVGGLNAVAWSVFSNEGSLYADAYDIFVIENRMYCDVLCYVTFTLRNFYVLKSVLL